MWRGNLAVGGRVREPIGKKMSAVVRDRRDGIETYVDVVDLVVVCVTLSDGVRRGSREGVVVGNVYTRKRMSILVEQG